MRLAQATVAATKDTVPNISTIRGVHYITFEGVHPWAGTFRKPGHEVGVGSLDCSLAVDVPRDLMRLRKEMVDNPLKGSKQYRSEVLAFYHASFLAIHPFADGNGRVARTILDFQATRLLGHPVSQHIERNEYIEALSLAQHHGQLKFLAKLIAHKDLSVSQTLKPQIARERGEVGGDDLLVSKPLFLEGEARQGRARR
jgi:fido (protein-threonine AMPylation protein)